MVSKDDPTTKQTGAGEPGAPGDVESDPSKDVDEGSDWTDEGGATTGGPSTNEDE
jgi:hypothetical protein